MLSRYNMGLRMKISVLVLLYIAFSGEKTGINADSSSNNCNFPALFNFGDSNSDTGGSYSIFHEFGWPNGKTAGKFIKRVADGRLIIDFLAESLGFPYLNEDLDKDATSYRQGANFAVAGQRIIPDRSVRKDKPTEFDYHLDNQVSRFFAFKARAIASKDAKIYPKPEAFSEALYTIDIGQNDIAANFGGGDNASYVADYFTKSVERLLNDGAKYLWVHNTCPWGCLPKALEVDCKLTKTCTYDKYGCRNEWNDKSQRFNSELKKRIKKLRKQYPKAVITLVDMYSAKRQLRTKNNGFAEDLKMKYCCGTPEVWCATNGQDKKNQTIFGNACDEPSKYLSWDGVHYTEAANKILAKMIVDGSFSKPRVSFSNACLKKNNRKNII